MGLGLVGLRLLGLGLLGLGLLGLQPLTPNSNPNPNHLIKIMFLLFFNHFLMFLLLGSSYNNTS